MLAMIISKDDSYHGWPTVLRRANGELLTVSSSGREAHVCPFGKVRLQRSSDDGTTWSDPEVLVDGPLDDRDAGLLETSNGTLIVSWFTSLAWMNTLCRQEMGVIDWMPAEQLARWRAARERIGREVQVRDVHGEFIIRSTDGGQTWSDPIRAGVSSPHGPTELDDGSLLFLGKASAPYETWGAGATFSETPITAAVSRDDGLTWNVVATVPCAKGHSDADYHEPHAVQASDGRILVHIRNHARSPSMDTLQAESLDGGTTWSTPQPLPFGAAAHPAHLLRLRDGRLLSTYGYREAPFGNRAGASVDCGQTWSEPILISDDGIGFDLGYPSTAELADGTLLSVWYEKMTPDSRAVLRQARWTLPSVES